MREWCLFKVDSFYCLSLLAWSLRLLQFFPSNSAWKMWRKKVHLTRIEYLVWVNNMRSLCLSMQQHFVFTLNQQLNKISSSKHFRNGVQRGREREQQKKIWLRLPNLLCLSHTIRISFVFGEVWSIASIAYEKVKRKIREPISCAWLINTMKIHSFLVDECAKWMKKHETTTERYKTIPQR